MKKQLQSVVWAFVGLLVLSATPASLPAQSANSAPTTGSARPSADRFDVEIVNGNLSLKPLEGRVDVGTLWRDVIKVTVMPANEQFQAVPATLENVAKYVRVLNPEANIVLSPDAAPVRIRNLKMRSTDIAELASALSFATDGQVRGTQFPGPANWSFTARPARRVERTVDVFNINGFLQQLPKGTGERSMIDENLETIEELIRETLAQLEQGRVETEALPQFKFHRGTGLFIVTGSPAAIEVSRKIINALPGQSGPGGTRSGQEMLESRRTPAEE